MNNTMKIVKSLKKKGLLKKDVSEKIKKKKKKKEDFSKCSWAL